MPANLRVVTYNIHKGIGGTDRKYQPQRIIDVLDNLQPQIVLLQEVDDGVPRSNKHRQVDMLAEALCYEHTAFQRNVHLKQGHYGNAILSHFPLKAVESVDLTIRPKKRRQALLARCRLDLGHHTRSLLIVNVHLGLAGLERQIQLRRLLKRHPLAQIASRLPVLIGGDYNDVYGNLGSRVMDSRGFQTVGKNILTFPAILPVRPLDRIFFRGSMILQHAFAARSRLARRASDHLPLVADFEIH